MIISMLLLMAILRFVWYAFSRIFSSTTPFEGDFQVRVYNKARQNMLNLKINPTETERLWSLYYHDEHFDVITKDNTFLCHSFYCTKCDCAYKANPHVCVTHKCTLCKEFCKPNTEVIKCEFFFFLYIYIYIFI